MRLAIAFLVVFSTAHAYVPPPIHYFRSWSEINKKVVNLQIEQERTILGQGTKSVREVFKIKRPGRYHWEADDDGLKKIKVLGKTRAYIGRRSNPRRAKLMEVISPVEIPLIYAQPNRMEAALKQVGIKVSEYELDLFQGKPHVRIGEKNGNRLYVSYENQLKAMQFQGRFYVFSYSNAQSSPKSPTYPSSIEIYENDMLRETIQLKSITSPVLQEKDFEL